MPGRGDLGSTPEHDAYARWVTRMATGPEPFALSVLVLSGFVRIVTNARVFDPPSTLDEAFAFVSSLTERPNARIIGPGPDHMAIFEHLCRAAGATGKTGRGRPARRGRDGARMHVMQATVHRRGNKSDRGERRARECRANERNPTMKNLQVLAARAYGYMAAARRSAGRRRRGVAARFVLAAALTGTVAAACGESPLANRAPVVTDDLSGAEVFVGDLLTVDLAGHFEDPDGDVLRYEAGSSPPEEAGVAVAGSMLTVTALAWGEAAVTVTARDPGGLTADQQFMVTMTPGLRRLKIGFSHEYSPAWSPDGARIALGSLNDGGPEIYVFDADGSNVEQLTNNGGGNYFPAWSPDGARIAFTSTRDGSAEIYVMDADGSDVERLTDGGGVNVEPAWSPDGARIAFASDRGVNGEIYVMNADGSDVERLTNNSGGNGLPAWSPDGAKIAFVSGRDGNTEIYVMNADGSDMERLTNNSAADGWPTWSPDGARIAFGSDRDGNWGEIYVMNADGSDVERLTDSYGAQEPAWSPDGTEIAFAGHGGAIYVAYIAVR